MARMTLNQTANQFGIVGHDISESVAEHVGFCMGMGVGHHSSVTVDSATLQWQGHSQSQ